MNADARPLAALRRRLRSGVRRVREDEEGQTLLLGVGMLVVVLALILVVASASAVYLDVKELTSLADSAAASAAADVDEASYYAGEASDSGPVRLTDAGVAAAAAEDLARQPSAPDLVSITRASTPDGTTAVVTLEAVSRPPFLPWGIIPSGGISIEATGSARARTAP